MDGIQVERLKGLTNINYFVVVNGERFVLRVSGQNTEYLGINRNHEMEIITAVSEPRIGAQVESYLLPVGHLVTGYINCHQMSLEGYRSPENIYRIVKTEKRLHKLPLVKATFSRFCRVENYAKHVHSMNVPFPQDFNKLLEKMEKIEQEQARDTCS